ncbi:MAG: LPS assembly lipoprotein LptE [Cephaloticoccus sp.]
MLRRLHVRLLTALLGLGLFAGCAGYQLGTGTVLAFQTLHVAPVTMRALIPQAQPILTGALREAFAGDGRVTLAPTPDADATLSITVRDYRRDVATVRPGDTGLARKFVVTLTAEATLVNNATGREFFHQRVIEVKRDVFTDSGQQQAEYQILPLLAQDLADKARHAVLDTW